MTFLKNITSKDIKLSQNTIKNLITSANIEQFEELCQKSEFIFPFLIERISKDFVKLINKEDLKTIFEFSKIYCIDFEDLIINSWLKFANEDLTDEIILLLETGTKEQKAYAIKYFSYIKDSVILEYLEKYSMSDYEPLRINCAKTLREFEDKEILNKIKNIIINSKDEFEKTNAYSFICAYGGKENIKFILQNCFQSPFLSNIISNLLDFNDFSFIKSIVDNETLCKIFNVLIDSYPEDISLNTILYYEIYNFIKIIYEFKISYSNNLLLLAKTKFSEFSENDNYSFDLDKNTKEELKKISKYLNSLNLIFDNNALELYNSKPHEYNLALEIIREYKLINYTNIIAKHLNSGILDSRFSAKCALILKDLNKEDLIDKNIINKIEDINIKAIIENCIK